MKSYNEPKLVQKLYFQTEYALIKKKIIFANIE